MKQVEKDRDSCFNAKSQKCNTITESNSLTLFLVGLLLFAVIGSTARAQNDQIASLQMSIENNGYVTIYDGSIAEHPILENSQRYTSKRNDIWTFNFTANASYSDYFIEIHLPSNAGLTYLKSSGVFMVNNNENGLVIKSVGKDSIPTILIQYKLTELPGNSASTSSWVWIAVMLIIISTIILAYKFASTVPSISIGKDQIKNDHNKTIYTSADFSENGSDDKSNLSNNKSNPDDNENEFQKSIPVNMPLRQKQILKLLNDRKGIISQSELERQVDFPKSSLSRNLASLELNGMITKEKIGMVNKITLRKEGFFNKTQ